jgi:hypothetical protein
MLLTVAKETFIYLSRANTLARPSFHKLFGRSPKGIIDSDSQIVERMALFGQDKWLYARIQSMGARQSH